MSKAEKLFDIFLAVTKRRNSGPEFAEIPAEFFFKTCKIFRPGIFNQKLFIETSIGPLKNELGFQKVQIIQRVNEKMGENVISEVIIK